MPTDATPPFIRALLAPAAYPHGADSVELIETHISWVLLAGDFAYKLKKPVDFGFLDFSTLDQRRFYCEEELRLNRRLAPDIYLEVLPLTGSPEAPRLGGDGEAFEFALKMRRFPQDIRLDHLLETGRLTADHIDRLAENLAAFHLALPPAPDAAPYGTPERVWHPMGENFEQIRPLLADADDIARLEALRLWSAVEWKNRRPALAGRKQDGFIRECHGDLHLGNIVLLDGEPVPFDCIEFNDNLRWIDIISDLAFAVMDLLDRGRPDFAHRLLNGWLEHSGDYGGLALLKLYQVYRAMVRAKVAALRGAQPGLGEGTAAAMGEEYRGYIALAGRLSRPGTPALFITHGFSGSGKTTLTPPLVERLGAIRLRSDVERKRLFGLKGLEKSGSGLEGGIYTADASALTYRRLAELAQQVVVAGYPVVVDATFLKRVQRDEFRALATKLGVPFAILDFRASEETLKVRVRQRAASGKDASEADLAVLEKQLAGGEAPREDEEALVVDTESPIDSGSLLDALRNRGLVPTASEYGTTVPHPR